MRKLLMAVRHRFELWNIPSWLPGRLQQCFPQLSVLLLDGYQGLDTEIEDAEIFVGWSLTPEQLARSLLMLGVELFICTDVSRDGTLQGPNADLLTQVLAVGPVQVIASGGISTLQDLQRLKALESQGLVGAIVGKALYEGAINLREALKKVSDTSQSRKSV